MASRGARRSLVFGAVCALAGLLPGLFVAVGAPAKGWGWMLGAAPAAAFLAGMGAWWTLASRSSQPSSLRGALSGALAGLASHPLCWALLLAATRDGGVAETPSLAARMSLVSLILLGWLTVPLGALLGWRYAARLRRAS